MQLLRYFCTYSMSDNNILTTRPYLVKVTYDLRADARFVLIQGQIGYVDTRNCVCIYYIIFAPVLCRFF